MKKQNNGRGIASALTRWRCSDFVLVCVFYAGMHESDIPRRAFIRNVTLIFRNLQTFYVIVLR